MSKRIEQIENRIKKIKELLVDVGEMRPGSLTRQYSKANKKYYYQVSYTYQMKSRTEYVKLGSVKMIRKQIKTYKGFKKLVQEWIDLAIEHSKLLVRLEKNGKK